MASAVIFGGGVGSRMKAPVPKQFMEINGKPLICWTIDKFENNSNIQSIVLVVGEKYINLTNKLVSEWGYKKITAIVSGGKTGQESIRQGLMALRNIKPTDELVFIHDAVRPVIGNELIDRCYETARLKGNAVAAVPAFETVAVCDDQKNVELITDRSRTWILRAPQVFKLGELLKNHEISERRNSQFIDSAGMMMAYGESLNIVECERTNIKVTFPMDQLVINSLLQE